MWVDEERGVKGAEVEAWQRMSGGSDRLEHPEKGLGKPISDLIS